MEKNLPITPIKVKTVRVIVRRTLTVPSIYLSASKHFLNALINLLLIRTTSKLIRKGLPYRIIPAVRTG